MSTGDLTLPSDDDVTAQMKAFEQQAAEDARIKKVEATKARLLEEAKAEEQARQAYARAHPRFTDQGHHVLLAEPGSGFTPQSTPQKTPPQPNPHVHGTPVMSAQRGYARRVFGTPSGKTPGEIREDDFIRRTAISAAERRNRRLRRDLESLDDVRADLERQLEENTDEQARLARIFFAGTGFGSNSPHKNTDKTYIKF